MQLRLIWIVLGILLLSGVTHVGAQDDEGTGCYPGARDRIRSVRTVCPEGIDDNEACWGRFILPLVPQYDLSTTPPNEPQVDWGALLLRLDLNRPLTGADIIELQDFNMPSPFTMLLLGRSTVIDKTVDTDPAPLQSGQTVRVMITGTGEVHSSPSEVSPTEGVFQDGSEVEALGRDLSGNWIEIRLEAGKTGWVNVENLVQDQSVDQARQLPVNEPLSFNFSVTPRVPTCNLPSSLFMQTPPDTPVTLSINDLPMDFEGSAVLTMQSDPNNPDGRFTGQPAD
jgi:hypothetical protein